jgi:hypothetical protein
MLRALAPIMVPIRARTEAETMNLTNISSAMISGPEDPHHLLPNISDRRPTRVKPMAKPAVHEIPTHIILGEGPIAALMSARVFASRTHPMYPDIWAKHVGYLYSLMNCNITSHRLTVTVPTKFTLLKYEAPRSVV